MLTTCTASRCSSVILLKKLLMPSNPLPCSIPSTSPLTPSIIHVIYPIFLPRYFSSMMRLSLLFRFTGCARCERFSTSCTDRLTVLSETLNILANRDSAQSRWKKAIISMNRHVMRRLGCASEGRMAWLFLHRSQNMTGKVRSSTTGVPHKGKSLNLNLVVERFFMRAAQSGQWCLSFLRIRHLTMIVSVVYSTPVAYHPCSGYLIVMFISSPLSYHILWRVVCFFCLRQTRGRTHCRPSPHPIRARELGTLVVTSLQML